MDPTRSQSAWILTGMKDTPEAMAVKLVEAMPPKLAKVMEELGLV